MKFDLWSHASQLVATDHQFDAYRLHKSLQCCIFTSDPLALLLSKHFEPESRAICFIDRILFTSLENFQYFHISKKTLKFQFLEFDSWLYI